MRTTLAIDDDVLAAAKEMAATEGKSVGEVISTLARNAMRPAPARRATRNGVPLLPVRPGAPRVTSEMVRQLEEDLS
jgi:hypothetical protein